MFLQLSEKELPAKLQLDLADLIPLNTSQTNNTLTCTVHDRVVET